MIRRPLALVALLLAGCHAPAPSLQVSGVPAPSAAPAGPWGALIPRAAGVGAATTATVVADQLIASLEPGTDRDAWMKRPELAGFALRGSLKLGGRWLLKLGIPAGGDRDEARKSLSGVPGLQRVTDDPVPRPAAYTFTTPDTLLAQQWAHDPAFSDTLDAWDKVPVADQAKVIVAVLDTGLDVDHPEFADRVMGAQNMTVSPATTDVSDLEGHGTHVMGIVGATGDNDAGVAGVAWGVKLMPVKVLGDSGTGGTFDIINGILYAARFRPSPDTGERVRVINMSLGVPLGGADAFYTEAVAEAYAAGILVVAAAGNDGRGAVGQPATTPHTLAVGATGHYLGWEHLAPFSNYGDRLDLVAPGEDILSTLPLVATGMGQTFGLASGTSMASPFVAGVAALVMAKYDKDNQSLTPAFVEKVRSRLLSAVDDLGDPGRDPLYGAGRLDAARAVTPATIDAAP